MLNHVVHVIRIEFNVTFVLLFAIANIERTHLSFEYSSTL